MYDWVLESINQAREIGQKYSLGWNFTLNSPANEIDVLNCEKALDIDFPYSYREFLLQFNGAVLFTEGHGFINIFEVNRVVQITEAFRKNFPDIDLKRVILFCEYQVGDFLGFDIRKSINNEYKIVDCWNEFVLEIDCGGLDSPIADSFEQWLRRIFRIVISKKDDASYWQSHHPLFALERES